MKSILLIAAEPGESALSVSRLERVGHRVVLAPGAVRAIQHARDEDFDLCLLNTVFGGAASALDATIKLCRELTVLPRKLPVIAFSASGVSPEDSRLLYDAGASAVICSSHAEALARAVPCWSAESGQIPSDLIPMAQRHRAPAGEPPPPRIPGTHRPQDPYNSTVSPSSPFDNQRGVIAPDAPISFDVYERAVIERAIQQCAGDKLAAAAMLGVGKSTLYRKIKKLGIK